MKKFIILFLIPLFFVQVKAFTLSYNNGFDIITTDYKNELNITLEQKQTAIIKHKNVYLVLNDMSIQAAIDDAPAHSYIILEKGTYLESITINKPITILGNAKIFEINKSVEN